MSYSLSVWFLGCILKFSRWRSFIFIRNFRSQLFIPILFIMEYSMFWYFPCFLLLFQDHESVIKAIYTGSEFVESASADDDVGIVLESTSFYAEQGGQVFYFSTWEFLSKQFFRFTFCMNRCSISRWVASIFFKNGYTVSKKFVILGLYLLGKDKSSFMIDLGWKRLSLES